MNYTRENLDTLRSYIPTTRYLLNIILLLDSNYLLAI